ncbi:sigma-54 dependent transcriptional regulator [Ideonella azotifigens]|uniref:Sigma-54 dependent transcriptional regulator n=1 Tax=Ideonella azotifigens TaxID=513160 RepID=A0ABN1K091_9BURK|nr:sigma-54 dependent transcriptional regulator [Ideonella azotifigens]MCD2344870.1 sigma-54 dependent transcriptional regulator [Ideonella azotifigens]
MGLAILIIEDETTLARNLAVYLERQGYEARTAASAEEGLAQLASWRPELVLCDHNLPGQSGLEALRRIRTQDPDIRVVMMTGYGSTELAVEAMKAGAADFLTKPLVLGEVKLLIERLLDQGRLANAVDYYTQREAQGSGLDKIIGESPPMRALKASIATLLDAEAQLADAQPAAALIVGETGTGKELVARALHFGGPRRARPFVELNCGALPSQLVEAELFGYERGAFTDARQRKAGLLETAEGGSVFLDEIGETELATQVKLLKLLEEKQLRRLGGLHSRPVDARVISATNRPLQQMVAAGSFRADLYYRLRIIELTVPPLRERGSDIVLLARHFLALHAGRYRKPGLRFSAEAERRLLGHAWPGNVRELRNAIEQAVLMAMDTNIGPAELRFLGDAALPTAPTAFAAEATDDEDLNLERMERRLVQRALDRSGQNVSAAARLLGVSRDTLRYRLERLGLRTGEDNGG